MHVKHKLGGEGLAATGSDGQGERFSRGVIGITAADVIIKFIFIGSVAPRC